MIAKDVNGDGAMDAGNLLKPALEAALLQADPTRPGASLEEKLRIRTITVRSAPHSGMHQVKIEVRAAASGKWKLLANWTNLSVDERVDVDGVPDGPLVDAVKLTITNPSNGTVALSHVRVILAVHRLYLIIDRCLLNISICTVSGLSVCVYHPFIIFMLRILLNLFTETSTS